MGKNNRKSKQTSSPQEAESKPRVTNQLKSEMMNLVNNLLNFCTKTVHNGEQEWNNFLEINDILNTISKKQSAFKIKFHSRDKNIDNFIDWLNENGVDSENVAIADFGSEGYGLKATRNIEMNDKFLSIPCKIMMSTESAKQSSLGLLIEKDRILQTMPNVVLALHLLNEYFDPNSFWQPYIHILPSHYSTPLYYTTDEIKMLKGTSVFSDVLSQRRNIARQYAYFFKFFNATPEASKININFFCYEDYKWAVSTVMTRQNQIPSKATGSNVTSLIPLWDMCNHTEGQITTDFSAENNASVCYALKRFKIDSQIYIYYGTRTNSEFLLHNGFVYPENRSDKMNIKLGVSKNDVLYDKKVDLLARHAMIAHRTFHLYGSEEPVDSETVAFLRVFCMDEHTLDKKLSSMDGLNSRRSLKDYENMVSLDNELKVWQFFQTRAELLQKVYPSTNEADRNMLKDINLSDCTRMIIKLRLQEKKILKRTEDYSVHMQNEITEKVSRLNSIMEMESENQSNICDDDEDDIDKSMQLVCLA